MAHGGIEVGQENMPMFMGQLTSAQNILVEVITSPEIY
jgi:hypothetical protein